MLPRFLGSIRWIACLIVLTAPHLLSVCAAGAPPYGPLDHDEAEAFFDRLFAREMENVGATGLVFTLVADGKVVLSRGYGYADRECTVPVSPETTLFPVGSLTKPVTATAAMQLVEQGRINLEGDVNQYLPHFQVDDRFSEPVTLLHLLTHTSGFDEQNIGACVHSASEAVPLAERVVRRLPPRVRPPGRLSAYANYNTDLAGYLVEQVSGVPFSHYLEENIFRPLGMRSTGLGSVARSDLFLSEGLIPDGQGCRPAPATYDDTPAYGMLTTGRDMGQFLLAHLQGGRVGDQRILKESTVRMMHSRRFAPHPRATGVVIGFGECLKNNERALTQGGFFPGHVSLLFLLPERGVGFFVSYNSGHYQKHINANLITAFLDHYYPYSPVEAPPVEVVGRPLSDFTGTYLSVRHSRLTPEKGVKMLYGELHVKETANGLLIRDQEWKREESLLFTRDGEVIVFEEDSQGNILYLHTPSGPCERVPWWDTFLYNGGGMIACGVLFAVAFLIELGRAAAGRASPHPLRHPLVRAIHLTTAGLAMINLLFLLRFWLIIRSSDFLDFLYEFSPAFHNHIMLWPVLAALTVGLGALVLAAWYNRVGSRFARVYYSFLTSASLGLLAVLYNLNLLILPW